MKNIFNKREDLKLYDKSGTLRYEFCIDLDDFSWECIYDSNGNELTHKNSDGYSYECTRDSNGKII